MFRQLIRAALGLSLLVGGSAIAEDKAMCGCGKPMEQCQKEGCTCGQGDGGQCALHAGKGMGMGMMGMHHGGMMGGMPTFDAKTVATFKGTVTSIDRVEHQKGMVGVHLRVQSGADSLVVHLGPATFVDPKMTFAVKDEVEFKGSKIAFNNESTVLATTVTRGGKSLELRKDDGTPLFRGPMSPR
jgi:hypothetical protein